MHERDPRLQAARRTSRPPAPHGVTVRAVLTALVVEAACLVWVADSEIRQSVYLICYSLMAPPILAALALQVVSAWVERRRPGWGLTPAEIAVVYVLVACALPIAGFGGLRFVLPTLGLGFHRTTPDDWTPWANLLPAWLSPRGSAVWDGFFRGEATPPWRAWLVPLAAWGLFLLSLGGAWVFLSQLLRRRWIDQERLAFPIAQLPIRMIREPAAFWRNPWMWAGLAPPAVLQSLLALNHLFPGVPCVQLKAWDIGYLFSSAPWNAIGYLPIGLYPTAIGLAFLAPADVTFSCWVFYLATKALAVAGAAAGLDMSGQSGASIRFPYPQEQAMGAWVVMGLIALRGLFGGCQPGERWLRAGAAACLLAATGVLAAAGAGLLAALLTVAVYALFVVCGARVRAEVGAQWTFAPLVWTPSQTAIAVLGPARLGERALVATSVFESVTVDVRGQALPNQLEGLQIAGARAAAARKLSLAIGLALLVGFAVAGATSLSVWYDVGASTAKANAYALSKSQIVWRTLERHATSGAGPDGEGLTAAGAAGAFTAWLAWMRTRAAGWPLHPLGYVLANTLTIGAFWFPYALAWCAKCCVQRYGGVRGVSRASACAVGLALGDTLTQALWTIAGRVAGFPVYQFLS